MAITDYNKHQKSIKGLETKIKHLKEIEGTEETIKILQDEIKSLTDQRKSDTKAKAKKK